MNKIVCLHEQIDEKKSFVCAFLWIYDISALKPSVDKKEFYI